MGGCSASKIKSVIKEQIDLSDPAVVSGALNQPREESRRKVAPVRFTKLETLCMEACKAKSTGSTDINGLLADLKPVKRLFEECKTIFKNYDQDSDGLLSFEELEACAKELKLTTKPNRIKSIYKLADVDNSSKMEPTEFLTYMMLMALAQGTEDIGLGEPATYTESMDKALEIICSVWTLFDRDLNGFIDVDEAVQASEANPTVATRMFHIMDTNDDNRITFREFLIGFEALSKTTVTPAPSMKNPATS